MWGRSKPKLPFIPGSELSGVVLEVGKNCTRGFKVGDKVFALRGKSAAFEVRNECLVLFSIRSQEVHRRRFVHGVHRQRNGMP